jgi:flagellar protein FliO/FliZ
MKRGARVALSAMTRVIPIRLIFAAVTGLLLHGTAFAGPTDANQVIVPSVAATKAALPAGAGVGTGALTIVAVVLFAGAGAWLLWRGRTGGAVNFNRVPRQLAVEETRSLGNRQYLVVASYQDKKFLLGVCPGRIDMLSPLNESEATLEKTRA